MAETPKIAIRNETRDDVRAISEVTIAAFETLEISGHTEQFVIEALRAADALALSLVAELDGRVIGHIAFSPVTLSDGTPDWYGLGPVSVLPDFQRQGIGKALIKEGLSRLQAMKARGCCLVGHPDYYRKFGFENPAGLVLEGVPREVFFALSFDGRIPQGSVTFHEAFKAEGRRPRHPRSNLSTSPPGKQSGDDGPSSATDVILESTITCPACGHRKTETMPTDACQFFYACEACGALLKPEPGDCCVFCSFGSVACPPVQQAAGCCASGR